jgi:hypothetical protein
MPFNPKTYAVRSDQVVENYAAREKWREENKHLALPFFVKDLRGQIPDIFPEEMALIGAASGDGKTEIMKAWHAQAQQAIESRKERAVTIFGSQEESTERLAAQDIEKRGPAEASSRPTVWIGTSFGMSADDMEDLHMTNFINTVGFVQQQSFAEKMPIADVFYDYLQATPNDPTRRDQISEGLYRLQVNDNTRRLFKAAKTFRCPVVTASQTSIKKLNSPYNSQMPIPGRGDFSEASGIYQIPDFVFGFWLARNTHSVGKTIEVDNWKFTVEKNLAFIWFLKARGHSPETAKGISKVFPLRIINDEYTYDADHHKSMMI